MTTVAVVAHAKNRSAAAAGADGAGDASKSPFVETTGAKRVDIRLAGKLPRERDLSAQPEASLRQSAR